jgi:hypothetical protein
MPPISLEPPLPDVSGLSIEDIDLSGVSAPVMQCSGSLEGRKEFLGALKLKCQEHALEQKALLDTATRDWEVLNKKCVAAANAFVNAHLQMSFVGGEYAAGINTPAVVLGMSTKLLKRAERHMDELKAKLDLLTGVYTRLQAATMVWENLKSNAANLGGVTLVFQEPVFADGDAAINDYATWASELSAMYRKELTVKHVICDAFGEGVEREKSEVLLSALLLEAYVDTNRLQHFRHIMQAQAGEVKE